MSLFAKALAGPKKLILGHRGMGSTEPLEKPSAQKPYENTLKSLMMAARLADGVEFDVMLSAGEELIVFHDATTQRLFPDELPTDIQTMSITEIKALKGGPDIPTLREFFQAISTLKHKPLLYMELKLSSIQAHNTTSNRERLLTNAIAALEEFGLEDQCMVVSFDFQILNMASELFPHALIGYNCEFEFPKEVDFLSDCCAAVCPDVASLDQHFLAKAEACHVKVLPFGENLIIESALFDSVAGVTTDNIPEATVLVEKRSKHQSKL